MRIHNLLFIQVLLSYLQPGASSLRSKGANKKMKRNLVARSEDDVPFDCDHGCIMSVVAPVCGYDDITYQNKCLALCQNVALQSNGECPGDRSMSDETYETTSEVTKSEMERFKDEKFMFVAKRKFVKFVKYESGYESGYENKSNSEDSNQNENEDTADGTTFVRRITDDGSEYVAKINMNDIADIVKKISIPHHPMDSNDHEGERDLQSRIPKGGYERGIVGKDTRKKVCLESCFPYSAIGEFDSVRDNANDSDSDSDESTLSNSDEDHGGCTGTVISSSAVITAAHCLYKDGKYTDLQYFAPGRYRNTYGKIRNPYKVWKVQFSTLFSKWVTMQGLRYDIAIAHFDEFEYRGGNIGDVTGYMGIAATTNDSDELQFATVTGYPYDKPDGEVWTSGECSGGFQAGYEDVITYHGCDSVKGNDGSALLDIERNIVYGVNVADVPVGPGYPDQSFTNIGVIIHKTNVGLIMSVAGIHPGNWREP